MREGTRSRKPHRSFARRCGRRDLGCFERLRGPFPVLVSAGQRRRVLGRNGDPGSAATLSLLGTTSARPPPALRGARPHEAGRQSQDCRLDVGGDRDSRLCPRVVTSCRSRRATSAFRSSRGKHRGSERGLARREEPPRGGPTRRTKGRREPNRTGVATGTRSAHHLVKVAWRWKALRIGAAGDLHGHA